jgi:para-nitrobenzyl esterase
MLLVALAGLTLASVRPVVSAAAVEVPLEVTVEGGVLRGTEAGGIREWRGVPYAAPPLNELRWRPPSPAGSWDGVREASEFGPPCVQLASETRTIGSEDCLYLNVSAPHPVEGAPGLPVMVHLHGGGNSGFWPYQDASAFVRHGVIVVTVAYRLGAFGWVGHPSLSVEGGGSSGEYGSLDQISALQWVQRNIAAFGGDPDNVTLFGNSAGSLDATALVVSPRARGLFQRAALQTESYWAFYEPGDIADAEAMGTALADGVGCSSATDVPACLRDLSAAQLVEALGFIDVAPRVGGEILPESPRDLLASQSLTVPLLVGSNRDEAAFFFEESFTGGHYGRNNYVRDTNALVGADAAAIARRLYPIAEYDGYLGANVALFTDAVYSCPMRALALTSSGPVWRYLYSHVYENNEFLASLGAAHFLDDPIMWNDSSLLEGFSVGDYQFSPAEESLSATMTTYWTNFARTGNPNGSGLPEWPQFSDAAPQTLEFDGSMELLDGWRTEQCSFLDTVVLDPRPGWFRSGKLPPEISLPGPR